LIFLILKLCLTFLFFSSLLGFCPCSKGECWCFFLTGWDICNLHFTSYISVYVRSEYFELEAQPDYTEQNVYGPRHDLN
jgi:hypothetical protein